MRPYLLLVTIAAMTAMSHRSAAMTQHTHETGFLDRRITFSGTQYNDQVYLPANWDGQKKWPMVLFLHGYGESGSDGLASSDLGLPSGPGVCH